MTPLDAVLRAADPAGGARRVGGQWLVRCPSHPDRRASLAVKETADGRVLLWCHAGCMTADVLAALGLAWRDLRP
jgi:hypothetical protein